MRSFRLCRRRPSEQRAQACPAAGRAQIAAHALNLSPLFPLVAFHAIAVLLLNLFPQRLLYDRHSLNLLKNELELELRPFVLRPTTRAVHVTAR